MTWDATARVAPPNAGPKTVQVCLPSHASSSGDSSLSVEARNPSLVPEHDVRVQRDARQAGSQQATAATSVIVATTPASSPCRSAATPNSSDAISRFEPERAGKSGDDADRREDEALLHDLREHAATRRRRAPGGCRSRGGARPPCTTARRTCRWRRAAAPVPQTRRSSCASSRGRRIDSANTPSISRSRTTGTVRSASRTTRSIAVRSAAGGSVVRSTTFIVAGALVNGGGSAGELVDEEVELRSGLPDRRHPA